jgi:hypothetical protein
MPAVRPAACPPLTMAQLATAGAAWEHDLAVNYAKVT